MEIVLIVVIAAVVVATVLGVVLARRRRSGDLEPPPETPSPRASVETPTKPEEPVLDEAEADQALQDAVDEAVAPAEAEAVIAEAEAIVAEAPPAPVPVRPRFRDRLTKARGLLSGYVGSLVGRDRIDDETWEELEEALIRADVGVQPTADLLDHLRRRVKEEGLSDGSELLEALKAELKDRLSGFDRDLRYAEQPPSVWLFVGVNGVGKTTTIGKVGRRETAEGRGVLMAAGDTFRAAAAEQLEMWA
jgi:fused signal recognition particle receptor